jgi:hypothetical protein
LNKYAILKGALVGSITFLTFALTAYSLFTGGIPKISEWPPEAFLLLLPILALGAILGAAMATLD